MPTAHLPPTDVITPVDESDTSPGGKWPMENGE
jgi:hypothetical protein